MSLGPLVVEIICTFCLAAFLLYKYGNWSKHHVVVTLSVLIAWYFSLVIIFILPIDVSSTIYNQCLKDHTVNRTTTTSTAATLITSPTSFSTAQTVIGSQENGSETRRTTITILPASTLFSKDQNISRDQDFTAGDVSCTEPWSHIPDQVLPILWRIVYWTSQLLTWLVLPLMQSYSQAGNFTVLGKLRSAVIDNAIYYGSYLFIFGTLLVYIAASPNLQLDGPKLKVICVTTSNTWGLFLLVLLLGYGLVEVPRSCWNSAKPGFVLNYTYFKAAKLNIEKAEAEDNVEDLLDELQRINEAVRSSHPLRKHVNTIIDKVPEPMRGLFKSQQSSHGRSECVGDIPSERTLIRLHRQLIRNLRIQYRTRTQWKILVDSAIRLEDIARNKASMDHHFKPSFQKLKSTYRKIFYTSTVEWYWECLVRSWVLKVLAVVLTVFSIFVVWSEVTFFNKSPALSLFAVFVNIAKQNYNYVYIEIISCVTIAYLCVCAYYTIFKIRVLNYYYLAPYHQTDEYSLIFSGMLLCRLTPPLCLNFLGLIHLDSHITKNHSIVETSYTTIMGHMDVISFISDGFNVYFPIGILVLCLATYFRIGSHLLHLVGFQQFIGDDEMTSDLVEEGCELIKVEKHKRQHAEDSATRRQEISERLSGSALYRTPRERGDSISKKSRKSNLRKGLKREDSTESARAELLQDIEPVDYTEGHKFEISSLDSPTVSRLNSHNVNRPNRLYQGADADVLWSSGNIQSRSSLQPMRGIFDDV